MPSVRVRVCVPLTTLSSAVKLPAAVGVPLNAPLAKSVSPAGNAPLSTAQLTVPVPPLVCSVME